MDEKLTLQDIIDLLAKKSGLTKKEADAFFREFLDVIVANVFDEELVKIKNFGTFKLTKVNSRESIDVNTGEKIEIPSHFKLSFLPDKSLKNLVNKPFSQFETTLIEDGVSFDAIEVSEELVEDVDNEDTGADEFEVEAIEVQTEEEKIEEEKEEILTKEEPDLPSQTNEVIKKEEAKSKLQIDEPKRTKREITTPTFVYTYSPSWKPDAQEVTLVVPSSKITIDDDENYPIDADEGGKVEPPLNINKVHEKIDQLKEAVEALANDKIQQAQSAPTGSEQEAAPVQEESTDTKEVKNIEATTTPTDNKIIESPEEYYADDSWKSKLKYALLGVLLAALIGAGIYYFVRLSEQKQNYAGQSLPVVKDSLEQNADNTVLENDSLTTDTASVALEEGVQAQPQEEVKVFPVKEVVRSGSSLRSISRRHYGKNVFWVYIYEENKDRIKNMNTLNIGQEIIVPDLKKYGVDPNNESDAEKAKQIEKDLYAGRR